MGAVQTVFGFLLGPDDTPDGAGLGTARGGTKAPATHPTTTRRVRSEPGPGKLDASRSSRATSARALRARSEAELELALGQLVGRRVALTITDNGRTMVSAGERHGRMQVRLHHMFLTADDHTLATLGRYLEGNDRNAPTLLKRYVDQHRAKIRRPVTRQPVLRDTGSHHDLGAIFDALNQQYFDDAIQARITWGRRTQTRRGQRRRSIKLGSYNTRDQLIRVHPVLDARWVPDYFVEYIVYHEMLHQHVPIQVVDGRRSMHSAEFRAQEQLFVHYGRAVAWERQHLDRLLGG